MTVRTGKQVMECRPAGYGLKRQGSYKPAGGFCHDNLHAEAFVDQPARYVNGFVCRDAAGNAEKYVFPVTQYYDVFSAPANPLWQNTAPSLNIVKIQGRGTAPPLQY
jgi:hypothetical protein